MRARTTDEMVFSGNTPDNLFEQTENDQPLNKLATRKSGCNRLCSVFSRSSVELAMNSLVLQDILLNIPAWARLHPDDISNEITGPVKRMANISLQASPCKRSKCCKIQSSAAWISGMTGSCKKADSYTTGADICQANLPSHTGLHATFRSTCKCLIPGYNNNNNGRTQRKRKCTRKQSRTRVRDDDHDQSRGRRSRSCSSSGSSSRSSSLEMTRSRKRPRKGILKRTRSKTRSRSRRTRRGRKSKRRVRFSRKITIWE